MYWSPAPLSVDERDIWCDPTVNDPRLETYNADANSETFYNMILDMKEHYRGNHMFIPLGEDFAWSNASLNWRNS